MGHVRLGVLPRSRKWLQVVELLKSGGSVEEIARASATAAERALALAAFDSTFQRVARLLVELPLAARSPDYETALVELGIGPNALSSLPDLAAAITGALDRQAQIAGERSDFGEMAQMALVESISAIVCRQQADLFAAKANDIRRAVGQLSSGQRFAGFARSFFSNLVQRSLNYYLSRELSNHVGPGQRFSNDADRGAFDRALAQHAFETARIVEDYAGGCYGKTVWQKGGLTPRKIDNFTQFAFKKMRDELGRRRDVA